MPEVEINEVVFLDLGDDGAEVLRSIPLLLRFRGWAVALLPCPELMPKPEQNRRAQAPTTGGVECCPFCRSVLSDQWIKAAHSRVAGRTGGRPAVLRECSFCRQKYCSRELRIHQPRCPKKPSSTMMR
jgi:hypothetical protein